MRKLFIVLIISLSSATFVQAQSFDWAISSQGKLGDEGTSVCIDPAGNSYVTGHFSSSPFSLGEFTLTNSSTAPLNYTNTKMFVAKLDQKGKVVWAIQSKGNGVETGVDIACDKSGHIVVVGSIKDGDATIGSTQLANIIKSSAAIFIMRLNPEGNIQWIQKAGGKGQTQVSAVSTGPQNDIYITGSFSHGVTFGGYEYKSKSGNNASVFVARYLPNGDLKWFEQIHGKGRGGQNSIQYGRAISAHDSGFVYAAGTFHGRTTFGNEEITSNDFLERGSGQRNVFLTKYDSDGTVIWTKSVGVKQINFSSPPDITDLAVDKLGSVYMTGYFPGVLLFGNEELRGVPSKGKTWNNDIFLAKYDKDGNHVWQRSAGGSQNDQAHSIAVISHGVVIGGSLSSLDARFGEIAHPRFLNAFIAHYDSEGKALWTRGGRPMRPGSVRGVATNGTDTVLTGTYLAKAITFGGISLQGTGTANFFAAKVK